MTLFLLEVCRRWQLVLSHGYLGPLLLCVAMTIAGTRRTSAGPENLFLVINSTDPASEDIGTFYQKLRRVPEGNVFRLEWKGGHYTVPIQEFRDGILSPILDEIRKRDLGSQITYVAYSTGFPFAIDYRSEDQHNAKDKAKASLTGLTYLHELAMKRDSGYSVYGVTNGYYHHAELPNVPETHGFPTPAELDASQKGKAQSPIDAKTGLSTYLMSVMLGFGEGHGNTPEEIKTYLASAAQADGTCPTGTIYFMQNEDIRSTTRDKYFPSMVAELQKMGIKAQVNQGVLPNSAPDVAGLVVGAAEFQWKPSRSHILPGAICEHLTSYGGYMATGGTQTTFAEFLRHGAAGASGTVEEPTADLHKFPHPAIQVHYARGCTLAEAFYQAVAGPYQLLIVGDPLCRPWAKIPDIQAQIHLTSPQDVEVEIRRDTAIPVQYLELFLDGKSVGVTTPEQTRLKLQGKFGPGRHEIRVVAIAQNLIRTRGRAIATFEIPESVSTPDTTSIPAE